MSDDGTVIQVADPPTPLPGRCRRCWAWLALTTTGGWVDPLTLEPHECEPV